MPPLFGADPPIPGWLSILQGFLALWPLWLPLVVGGLAIFWLLPRPRAYPWVWGALAGVLSLILGGAFLVRTGSVSVETLLFYAFSGIAIVSGALLVTQHNPARAALSFALVVLSTCGLFLLLAAPFLMAATIIVYAGAIVVTFLFVLMLAQQEGLSDADDRSREPLLATLTGFVLLGALLYVLKLGYDTRELDRLLVRVGEALAEDDVKTMRELVDQDSESPESKTPEAEKGKGGLPRDLFSQSARLIATLGSKDMRKRAEDLTWEWTFSVDEKLETQRKPLVKLEALMREVRETMGTVQPAPGTPLSNLSGTPASTPYAEVRRNASGLPELPAENAAFLGRSLFTDFLLPVELAGTLLLVATIGAIAIGQRRDRGAPPGRTA